MEGMGEIDLLVVGAGMNIAPRDILPSSQTFTNKSTQVYMASPWLKRIFKFTRKESFSSWIKPVPLAAPGPKSDSTQD